MQALHYANLKCFKSSKCHRSPGRIRQCGGTNKYRNAIAHDSCPYSCLLRQLVNFPCYSTCFRRVHKSRYTNVYCMGHALTDLLTAYRGSTLGVDRRVGWVGIRYICLYNFCSFPSARLRLKSLDTILKLARVSLTLVIHLSFLFHPCFSEPRTRRKWIFGYNALHQLLNPMNVGFHLRFIPFRGIFQRMKQDLLARWLLTRDDLSFLQVGAPSHAADNPNFSAVPTTFVSQRTNASHQDFVNKHGCRSRGGGGGGGGWGIYSPPII